MNVASKYPLVVIGAGAGGLVIAMGAAKAGKKVLLIEKGPYGGDCTNFGCIPSKSLIASAEKANSIKEREKFGLEFSLNTLQADSTLARVRRIVSEIRSHEDPASLAKNGVETLTGVACFLDPHHLKVESSDGQTTIIYAEQIVIASGSSPFIPDIKGLSETPFLTNETIFDLEKIPCSLAILGGGPIGCELAQTFSRLGSKISLIHTHEYLLNKEEKEAQELIAKQFLQEGIQLHMNSEILRISAMDHQFHLLIKEKNSVQEQTIQSEKVLVCVGRRPNIKSLKLEMANVKYSLKGITVDHYGRTNQRHIWAVGDVTGGPLFTHAAENQARSILTSLLLPSFFKKKIDHRQPVPRVTYTDPEIASVGLLEKEALQKYKPSQIAIYYVPLSLNDRAITASRTEGFVKIITKKWSSRILGAVIAAPRAGEMLMEISTAMYTKLPLRKIASLIHPYPTFSLAIRKAADLWLTQTIIPSLKKLFKRAKVK